LKPEKETLIGEITGVSAGTTFPDRRSLHEAGIHRPLQAGIAGAAKAGAESIVLSGGYVDDEDFGDEILYTGHGGRDQLSGRQNADQKFTRQNQALVTSCLEGLPVRVIRGSGHKSDHSPSNGYRYDGLYWVDSYWKEQGADGFMVCRFRLTSTEGLRGDVSTDADQNTGQAARRATSTIQRVVRDTRLGRQVKELYEHRCQVCGIELNCEGGPYAEAAHIRPLGRPHDGPDELANLLCLCPNHHVLFDRGGLAINDDLSLSIGGQLQVSSRKHRLDLAHIRYHRNIWQ
jgi:putative restriction endonuclease